VDAEAAATGRDWKEFLNPESLVVVPGARIEPYGAQAAAEAGARFQFERVGYFCSDAVDSRPDALVFNRTVTLKDSWAAAQAAAEAALGDVAAARSDCRTPRASESCRRPRRRRWLARAGTRAPAAADGRTVLAELLTREVGTAWLLRSREGGRPRAAANWIVNERHGSAVSAGRGAAFGSRELAALLRLVTAGEITTSAAREVLASGGERRGPASHRRSTRPPAARG
jgi:glutaminyl-tRNA synthetase